MSATVDILTKTVNDVLCVPVQCVTTRNDSLGVFTYKNGSAVWAPVEVGIQNNSFIEIKSGLKEGEQVISGPYDQVARKLTDGDIVSSADIKEQEEEKSEVGISVSIN